jgi:hypothetical protein
VRHAGRGFHRLDDELVVMALDGDFDRRGVRAQGVSDELGDH